VGSISSQQKISASCSQSFFLRRNKIEVWGEAANSCRFRWKIAIKLDGGDGIMFVLFRHRARWSDKTRQVSDDQCAVCLIIYSFLIIIPFLSRDVIYTFSLLCCDCPSVCLSVCDGSALAHYG